MRCLQSIPGAAGARSVETLVVDNGSADGSVEAVRAHHPGVELLVLAENRGFAAGTNAGLQRARGRFHVWLNSDCELPEGSLDALVLDLELHPEASVNGPRLVYGDGRIQPSAQAFPTGWRVLYQFLGLRALARARWLRSALRAWGRMDPMTRTYLEGLDPRTEAREVDWISGACLVTREETTRAVGLLDEGYFMYCEDADWCQRVRSSGAGIRYVPSVVVTHHAGASGSSNPLITYHYYRSLLRYFCRFRPHEVPAIRLLMFSVFAIRSFAFEGLRLFGRRGMNPWWKLTRMCGPGGRIPC